MPDVDVAERQLRTLPTGESPYSCAFSPDGALLAVSTRRRLLLYRGEPPPLDGFAADPVEAVQRALAGRE